jgi:hypothetical protein
VHPEDVTVTQEDIDASKKAASDDKEQEQIPTEPGTYTLVRLIATATPLITEENIRRSRYDGPVYDVKSSHPDNVLYVRRNGKPIWIYGSSVDVQTTASPADGTGVVSTLESEVGPDLTKTAEA